MPDSDHIWNQAAQKAFFETLKTKSTEEQSLSILAKAKELTMHQNGTNHDLLKAAESLMNMHTLKYRSAENKQEANSILASIYDKLGEKEKAIRFLK